MKLYIQDYALICIICIHVFNVPKIKLMVLSYFNLCVIINYFV